MGRLLLLEDNPSLIRINYNINNLSTVPTESDQANFNCLFCPYAWINEDMYLYYNGNWHSCNLLWS